MNFGGVLIQHICTNPYKEFVAGLLLTGSTRAHPYIHVSYIYDV